MAIGDGDLAVGFHAVVGHRPDGRRALRESREKTVFADRTDRGFAGGPGQCPGSLFRQDFGGEPEGIAGKELQRFLAKQHFLRGRQRTLNADHRGSSGLVRHAADDRDDLVTAENVREKLFVREGPLRGPGRSGRKILAKGDFRVTGAVVLREPPDLVAFGVFCGGPGEDEAVLGILPKDKVGHSFRESRVRARICQGADAEVAARAFISLLREIHPGILCIIEAFLRVQGGVHGHLLFPECVALAVDWRVGFHHDGEGLAEGEGDGGGERNGVAAGKGEGAGRYGLGGKAPAFRVIRVGEIFVNRYPVIARRAPGRVELHGRERLGVLPGDENIGGLRRGEAFYAVELAVVVILAVVELALVRIGHLVDIGGLSEARIIVGDPEIGLLREAGVGRVTVPDQPGAISGRRRFEIPGGVVVVPAHRNHDVVKKILFIIIISICRRIQVFFV